MGRSITDATRRYAGLCVRCGKVPVEKYRNCMKCREKDAAQALRRYYAKRAAQKQANAASV